jgi:G3E family GTPase
MSRPLPVTLVGGFLGAGKTSFLHHIISEHQGGHLAVLVENPGPLNLDAKAIRGLCGAMRRANDTVLEIPNDGDEDQLAWIAARLKEFSLAGRHERVLIEVAGTTNPARLAEHFLPQRDGLFAKFARLEQVICLVDALDYFRGITGPVAAQAWLPFQNEQIASASLVVLNKCDLLDEKSRDRCLDALHKLRPGLRVAETAYGEVPAELWSTPATTIDLAANVETSLKPGAEEAATPDLASALYRVHRPFHPQRFWDWFNADHPGLLRVKGLIWLGSRNLLVGGVSRTRWQNGCGTAGIWWAALPREEWPEDPAALQRMQEYWREPYGDRRQELVLIGEAGPLSNAMRRELDACLLTDEEYNRPVTEWSTFPDPFPEWDVAGD